jgi:hypothetical protein
MLDLSSLQLLGPRAIAWVKDQERRAMLVGKPLKPAGIKLAIDVGVGYPERIRVCVVPALPIPDEADLRQIAIQEMRLPHMTGLTLGYAVFVRNGSETSKKLLRHEFRHVSQYEVAGSIDAFVLMYLMEIVQYGYDDAPFEKDARAHEGVGLLDSIVDAI